MSAAVRLRPVGEADLERLLCIFVDSEQAGEWLWFGFRPQRSKELERRWREDALIAGDQSYLAVRADEELAGWVTWLPVARSTDALEIGIALFPEFRGRGIGTAAQRQLVEYLFSTTPVHRLQAATDVDNVGEQRALEKAGFTREGVLRGLIFRAGAWRDSVIYGFTRDDL